MTGRLRGSGPGPGVVGMLLVSLVLAAVALAGCTSTSNSGASNAAPQAAAPGGADSASGGNVRGPAGGQGSPALAPQQRAVIYTGSMNVTVTDVVRAADAAGALAIAAGGNIASDRRTLDGDNSEADLSLQVPSAAFSSTLDKLSQLGTEQSRSVQTQDVTDQLIDLQARLATQRASVDRVRTLFAKATTVNDIVTIESELAKREADLDSLEQREAAISGQVALSTISVTLRAKPAPPAPAQARGGLLAGLRSGWSAFLTAGKVFLTVIGWLAPWLVIIGIPVSLIVFAVRRRRRPVVQPAAPGPGGPDQP
jgi:uncharacterized protein DUF4349